mmetsp:Transcript_22116/g.71399  ORF Transcript_22116/g.71399 Transcript_22116/m.71399 type:complete len:217 (-) Transcript_22116:155-805(-)|eukprot:scaffold31695_cov118-Isochrysis_galbana.AAC.1
MRCQDSLGEAAVSMTASEQELLVSSSAGFFASRAILSRLSWVDGVAAVSPCGNGASTSSRIASSSFDRTVKSSRSLSSSPASILRTSKGLSEAIEKLSRPSMSGRAAGRTASGATIRSGSAKVGTLTWRGAAGARRNRERKSCTSDCRSAGSFRPKHRRSATATSHGRRRRRRSQKMGPLDSSTCSSASSGHSLVIRLDGGSTVKKVALPTPRTRV